MSATENNISKPAVHTIGTIFAIDGNLVVGINPTNGQTFSVQMENSIFNGGGSCTNFCTSPLPPSEVSSSISPPAVGSLIIAGDGYAYVPYSYTIGSGSVENTNCGCGCTSSSAGTQYLNLLRVGPSQDSAEISFGQFPSGQSGYECDYRGHGVSYGSTATVPTLITNADQGVLASYTVTDNSGNASYYLATTSGASLVSQSTMSAPGQQGPVQPILQRADGSYIGNVPTSTGNPMIAFTSSGGTLWTVPNDTPQIATAGGGVIGTSGTTYDQNGNVTGQLGTLPTYSFKGAYQLGSIKAVVPVSDLADIGTTLVSVLAGNLTGNGVSFVHQTFALNWCANQSCQLAYAEEGGGTTTTDSNVDFYYQMAEEPAPHPLPPPLELNASQIAIIENQALSALQQAFHAFPSRVLSIGSNLTSSQYTHMAEVSGGYFVLKPNTIPPCGLTAYPRNASTIWYPCDLSNAQWALDLQATDLSHSTSSANFQSLLKAVGEGIGNNAAHEIAHQFLSNSAACLMNDDANLKGVYNGGSGTDPAVYTGTGPNGTPIHWSEQTAFCLVQMILEGKSLSQLRGLQP